MLIGFISKIHIQDLLGVMVVKMMRKMLAVVMVVVMLCSTMFVLIDGVAQESIYQEVDLVNNESFISKIDNGIANTLLNSEKVSISESVTFAPTPPQPTAGEPDLTPVAIAFTNVNPASGEVIFINATIQNVGAGDANNVLVQFWDYNPIGNFGMIGIKYKTIYLLDNDLCYKWNNYHQEIKL